MMEGMTELDYSFDVKKYYTYTKKLHMATSLRAAGFKALEYSRHLATSSSNKRAVVPISDDLNIFIEKLDNEIKKRSKKKEGWGTRPSSSSSTATRPKAFITNYFPKFHDLPSKLSSKKHKSSLDDVARAALFAKLAKPKEIAEPEISSPPVTAKKKRRKRNKIHDQPTSKSNESFSDNFLAWSTSQRKFKYKKQISLNTSTRSADVNASDKHHHSGAVDLGLASIADISREQSNNDESHDDYDQLHDFKPVFLAAIMTESNYLQSWTSYASDFEAADMQSDDHMELALPPIEELD
jgi:hypothetical protein